MQMQPRYMNKICSTRRACRLISTQVLPKYKMQGKDTYEPLDLLEGMMSSSGCYDRFKVLNNLSIYRYSNAEEDTSIESLKSRKISSMKDIMHSRAKELIELSNLSGNKLIVFWSGGVDSSSLLCSLILEGLSPENCVILCTDNSIKEYPYMYKRLVQSGYQMDDFTDYIDPRTCYYKYNGNYFVLGWCADQLYGSFLNQYFDTTENYKDSLHRLFTERNPVYNVAAFHSGKPTDKDAEVAITYVQKYAESLNLPLETFQDVTWMINFGVKWTAVQNSFALAAPEINSSKIVNFFETDDFSAWGVQNYPTTRTLNQQNPKEYKWELKEIVYNLLKDEEFLQNKGKVNSWVSNYSRGNKFSRTYTILTNQGIKVFRNLGDQMRFLREKEILKEGVLFE